MKSRKLVSLLIVVVMTLSLCASAMAADAYKLGMIGPLTGPAADYGNNVRYGMEIAVEEINALGGLQLDANYQDDEHDYEKSVNAYSNLLDWGVQAIVGCVTSTPCAAVASEACSDRVFMLTPSASADSLLANDVLFQICFCDSNQGSASATYMSEHTLGEKIAVIYNNADVYSTGIYQTFSAKAAELGLNIVAVSTFTDSDTDFTVQLTAAKEAGADVVFLPIYYTPASMILKQANDMEYSPVFFGVDGMDGILSIEGFDTSLAEGVMLLTPFVADAEDELTVNFVTKYQEKYNAIPSQFAADAYDAVYVMYNAFMAAGVTADMSWDEVCELLIATLPTMEPQVGLTGTMVWDETGAVTKDPRAMRIENGVYVGA